jgi:hypothetical protein
MSHLQERMAEYGFESNDDYEYPVRCLLANPVDRLRCLNVAGESNRRKTAFASALAQALGYPHVLYHDFTQQHPPEREEILPPTPDAHGLRAVPITPLDQILSESCAFSEGDPTILILDQLQAADFREHLRLYKFLQNACWETGDAAYFANPRHLLVFLISEEPLYHSLQKSSFRVWVNQVSNRQVQYEPGEFGLGNDARPMMEALARLFEAIGLTPTRTEYRKLLHDIHVQVRDAHELRQSIYGWTEGVDHRQLFGMELNDVVERAATAIRDYLGAQTLEIGDSVAVPDAGLNGD